MTRPHTGIATAAALAALAIAGCTSTAQTPSAPSAATAQADPATLAFSRDIDLGDGLHMLMGAGGNLGLLTGDDGVFLIDDQYVTNAIANLEKIEAMAGGKPKFLVNTHWHFDHAGGNATFQTAGATVFAHENVRKRMTGEIVSNGGAATRSAAPPEAWPIVTFASGVDFHLNGQTIRAFKAPNAHTDGDVMVYFVEANVLHTGDTFMQGRHPFIDTGSGGTAAGVLAAHEMIFSIAGPDTRIIPGHGELSTVEDVRMVNKMMKDIRAAVEARVKAGDSLEKIIASDTLKPWAQYFTGTLVTNETVATVLYNELTAAK